MNNQYSTISPALQQPLVSAASAAHGVLRHPPPRVNTDASPPRKPLPAIPRPSISARDRRASEAAGEDAGHSLLVVSAGCTSGSVGPHPHWSCQIAFDAAEFDEVVEWLDAHRNGLDVFVHGVTGDDYVDHTAHAMWLGNESTLDLRMFRKPQA
jgi:DOPA 4,5-dioxygenase